MVFSAILGAALLAQAVPVSVEQIDVAYDQLQAEQNRDAVEKLQALHAAKPSDPAILINLGAAYVREGQIEDARDMFEAVLQSEERYQLETANGAWVDSRWLARKAIADLDAQTASSGPIFASAD